MSQVEALRIQLDNLHIEVQQLQVENARLREGQPEAAAVIDANAEASRCRKEATWAVRNLEELRQMLHESQEGKVRATEDAKAVKVEMEELKLQLQDHGTRTDDSSAQF